MAAATPSTAPTERPEYYLKRDHIGTSRLNLQHYLWKASTKFTLHPHIPKLQPGMQVADIATGTAVWLLDLASESPPEVEFTGTDITLQMTPVKEYLPSNVKLQQWDIFQPLPLDLIGKFDVVHVAFLILVVKTSTIEPLLANVAKLLKPGGYLQWDEYDPGSFGVEKRNASIPSEALNQMTSGVGRTQKDKDEGSWIKNIPPLLEAHGIINFRQYSYVPDQYLLRYFHDLHLMSWEETAVGRMGGPSETIDRLLDKANAEVQGGAGMKLNKVVWVARKALNGDGGGNEPPLLYVM